MHVEVFSSRGAPPGNVALLANGRGAVFSIEVGGAVLHRRAFQRSQIETVKGLFKMTKISIPGKEDEVSAVLAALTTAVDQVEMPAQASALIRAASVQCKIPLDQAARPAALTA